MASNSDGTDETPELFHILNGTDDEIITFTELKPVRLSFQAERFVSTQDIYYDDQSYSHVDHNDEPTEASEWTNNGSTPTATNLTAESLIQLIKTCSIANLFVIRSSYANWTMFF